MAKIVYAWKETRGYKVSAQIIGEELEKIEREHGEVEPSRIISAARSPSSVLHQFFDWDNASAANLYRLSQARTMIQCLVVKAIDGNETKNPVRAFVSLMADDDEGREYVGMAAAMSDREKREQILSQARTELEGWRLRYEHLQEFAVVVKAIDKLKIKRRKKSAKERVASSREHSARIG